MALIAPVLVPPDAVNATVSPPAVRLLPAASLARRVRIALPPEMMLAADTVTVDCVVVAAPGTTVIVGSAEVTATLLIVAPIVVAVPASTPVNVAVYVPFPLSVVAPIVPVLVPPVRVNTTASPPAVRLFPEPSFAWRVRVAVDPDATVALDTATVEVAVDAPPVPTTLA